MGFKQDDKERYHRYLCSPEWGQLKRRVLERSKGLCERCKRLPADSVHHLTYIRKYNEQLDDLQAICSPCHEYTHGKRDDDPAAATGRFLGRTLEAEPASDEPKSSSFRLTTAAEIAVDSGPDAFRPGLRVLHPQYGLGKIITIHGDGANRMGRVLFTIGGERTFTLAQSPLRPIGQGEEPTEKHESSWRVNIIGLQRPGFRNADRWLDMSPAGQFLREECRELRGLARVVLMPIAPPSEGRRHVEEAIAGQRPEFFLFLGGIVASDLLETDFRDAARWRGRWYRYQEMPAIVTHQPELLVYSSARLAEFREDYTMLLRAMGLRKLSPAEAAR